MKHIEQKIQYDTRVVAYPNGDTVVKTYQKKLERKISTIENDKKVRSGRVSSVGNPDKKYVKIAYIGLAI